MTLRRSALFAALSAAALLPACSSNPVIPTQVSAAALQITVEPNPVIATQNPLTFVTTASYRITITELNGLGGTLNFVSGTVYEPSTGRLVSLNYFDSADLIVFVGKDRMDPSGTISFSQTATYTLTDFSKAATLTVTAQMKDDHGNLINASTLVNIQ